jgi:riboflavin kinase/FMN adenylyltransferase
MLARVHAAANRRGLMPAVMIFEPHPREYFAVLNQRPELAPTRITGLRDKLDALARSGIQQVVVERFNARLADMSPETFIESLLVRSLDTRWILVGPDFRFGRKRTGNIDLLREAGKHYGFEVETLEDITDAHGHRISSSEVRTALAVGDLARAQDLLGHPYHLSGHVVHGRKLGRALGFPTLNVHVTPRCAARSGIYVARVHGLGNIPLPAVASLGVRPTIENHGPVLLEAHVLDVADLSPAGPPQGGKRPLGGQQVDEDDAAWGPNPTAGPPLDAYGKLVRIEFLQQLRDEEKFPDLPSLITAIAEDTRNARAYFAVHGL